MHRPRRRISQLAAESLVAIAALALLTWGAYRLHARPTTAALLYLALVVLVSLRGSLGGAIVVSIAATLCLDYFFLPSARAFLPTSARDVVALAVFSVTAIVITRLVTALRASEGRWRNVFENNPTMYFMIDGSGTVLSVNPAGAEQLGYTPEELVGRPVLNVFLEDDKTAASDHVARCLAHLGESMSWELRKVRKDGTMLWVRETARAVRLGTESPVVLIACEDITDQKAARDKLRDNEARLRGQARLLDLTHDAIFVRGLNDVITYWNHGAEELYGWSKAEALGRVTHELLRTEFPAPLDEIIATVLRSGRWEGELVHTKRNSTRVVVASRWSLQRDEAGKPTGILETNNDVTERKRAEEELRRSEAYLAEAQRLSHTGSFGWRLSDDTITWSEETYRIFGFDRATRPTLELIRDRIHPEDKAAVHQVIDRAHREAKDFELEHRLLLPDGSVKHLHVVARARKGESGQLEFVGAIMDITERERAAEALRRNEAYLAESQRLTHTGSWAVDYPAGKTVYWSEETFRICGIDPQRGLPNDEEASRLAHPEDSDRIAKLVDKAFREKADYVADYRMVLHDGTLKYVHLIGHPVLDKNGEPVEYVGTVVDVTDRKRAEEERRAHLRFLESMDRVNRAIQSANDIEQMMSDVLATVLSIFDCDRAWLIYPCDPGAPTWRVVMEHTRPGFPGAFALSKGRDLPMDDTVRDAFRAVRTSDGPVRFGPEPLQDSTAQRFGVQSALAIALHPKVDEPYLFGLHQCSHPRVWTQQEERLFQEIGRRLADALTTLLALRDLRESARRYRNIFQMAEVSIWEEDFSRVKAAIDELRASGVQDFRRYFAEHPEFVARAVQLVRIVDVNDATLRLFGAGSKDELLVSLHKVFTPETLDVFAGELLAVAERRTSFAAEAVVQTLSGEPLDVVFTMAFPPQPANLESVLVSIMDVSARKRAEEALRKAQAELARASTLTTMGQLAASIAHELRQPLAAIAMNGSATLRWLNRESPDLAEAREAASRIVGEAQRADEVIRGLRSLMGQSGLQREALDMNDAVHQVLELARGELRRNEVSVQADLDPTLPPALGDRVQLQQVVLNLIVNAIEAMVAVADTPKTLVIRTARADTGELTVAVEDTGPGLDPATAGRIFDPFFTTKANGLGMGLSISRSIVEAHGGQLSASPRSPHGTTFRFTVPTTAEARSTSARSEAQQPRVDTATGGLATT